MDPDPIPIELMVYNYKCFIFIEIYYIFMWPCTVELFQA